MAYHLSVVEIIHEINQQDTPPSPKPRTPEMSITLPKVSAPEKEKVYLFESEYEHDIKQVGNNR